MSIVFLAMVVLAPAPVRAGCGDHVVVVSSPYHRAPISVPTPAKKPASCTGPYCTRSPLAPPLAPAVPNGPDGQQWACLLEPLHLPANQSSPNPEEALGEPQLFLASGIYHPPR